MPTHINQRVETEIAGCDDPARDRWRSKGLEDALRRRRSERQELRRRHEEAGVDAAAHPQPFSRAEEEGLILDHRPAGRKAELVAVEELFRKSVRVVK